MAGTSFTALTPENLALAAGFALSLGFEYIPGLRAWYNALQDVQQQAIMGLALLLVTVAIFAASCTGNLNAATCDQQGLFGLLTLLLRALATNQATYMITPKRGAKEQPG